MKQTYKLWNTSIGDSARQIACVFCACSKASRYRPSRRAYQSWATAAQLSRWWARYQAGGLQTLLAEPSHPGSKGQMTAEAWADLEAVMKQGQVATLEQAR